MTELGRRLGVLVASMAVIGSLGVLAPAAASAEARAVESAVAAAPRHCKPAHWGRDWRWHEGRRGGHWDHWQRNRWGRGGEWKHHKRDDRYCERRWNHRDKHDDR